MAMVDPDIGNVAQQFSQVEPKSAVEEGIAQKLHEVELKPEMVEKEVEASAEVSTCSKAPLNVLRLKAGNSK